MVKAQIEEVVYNLTAEQYKDLVIAYEPVWAIGTGKTATADQAQEIHAYIRKVLAEKFGAAAAECPILYGGSCKPSNAAEIFAKGGRGRRPDRRRSPQGRGLPRHRQGISEIVGNTTPGRKAMPPRGSNNGRRVRKFGPVFSCRCAPVRLSGVSARIFSRQAQNRVPNTGATNKKDLFRIFVKQ